MRTLRESLARVAAVVLAVQFAGTMLAAAGEFLERDTDHTTCCCCRRDSGALCPLSGRMERMSARCGCGCQDRDALPAAGPDPLAVLPDACVAVADLAACGALVDTRLPLNEFNLVPPSPPPRRISSRTVSQAA